MSPRGHTRAWWLAVLAAAVLLGVLSMTWFGPQRMAHAEGVGVARHTATAAHDDAGHAHRPSAHSRDLDLHDEDDHSHAFDILLGVLIAFLAAALAATWARVPRRPMVILRRVRERMFVTGRQPDPPCLKRLSIQRC